MKTSASDRYSEIVLGDLHVQIKRLTAVNDHTGSVILLAKALGRDDLVAKLQGINAVNINLRYMPAEKIAERGRIRDELLGDARVNLPAETYERLRMSF